MTRVSSLAGLAVAAAVLLTGCGSVPDLNPGVGVRVDDTTYSMGDVDDLAATYDVLRADPLLFGAQAPVPDAFAMLEALEPYIAAHLERGGRLHAFTRHLVGLFPGRPGARQFRRHLAERCVGPDATLADLRAATAHVSRHEAAAAA